MNKLCKLTGLAAVACYCSLGYGDGGKWQVVYKNEFGNKEIGKEWVIQAGQWNIKEGRLACSYGPAKILLDKRFEGKDLKLEYDCISPSGNPGDLSCFLGGADEMEGYFFGFGSDHNSETKILRRGEVLGTTGTGLIKPGTVQHVLIERAGDTLTMSVDGKVVLKAADKDVIRDNRVGFYIWTEGAYDNVVISVK